MNKLKRFGTIYSNNMNKVIDETILNDTKQMDELYDKIDKLNIIIKEKEDIIKTYEETFNGMNKKINLLYKDIYDKDIKIKELEKYINNDNIKEVLKDEVNIKTMFRPVHKMVEEEYNTNRFIPTPSISSDNNSIDVNYERMLKNKEKFRITVNKLILTIRIKKFLINIPSKIDKRHDTNNSKPIKPKIIRKQRNKDLPAIERYPVTIYDKSNSELLNFVSEENKFLIKFQYKIAEKLDKKIEEISINDIIDFKIKCEGLNDNKDQRKRLKFKIERCKILYEKYGEKLSRVKISLNYLSEMPEKIWFEWLQSLDNLINNIYINSIKCDYRYKNNKVCGKYDCRIKHKDNI